MTSINTATQRDPFADMDDDLGEVYKPATPREQAARKTYRERCPKCNGSGIWRGGMHYQGKCFACEGRGWNEYATSPEQRAKGRLNARRAAQRKADAKLEEARQWGEDHPAELVWMGEASARGFGFAASMLEALQKWGGLTERQLAAVRKCMAADADRQAKRAEQAKQADARGGDVDVSRIHDAFAAAMEHDIKRPKLALGGFVFKRAPDHGRNAGAIYVTMDGDYMGKCAEGRFIPVRECSDDVRDAVIEAASNPEAAATAYGKRTGRCSCCLRELTNHASIDRGIGPICAEKYGW